MLQSQLGLIAIASVVAMIAGCDANFHSIYRTTPAGTGAPHSQAVVTDAKQGITVMNFDTQTQMFKVCAARSPDVFSALTTAFQGDASAEVFSKFAAAVSGSGTSAESASAFGLRTQLTQSQMELLYQLCLASLNGTITPDQMATEIHRYQNTMVTMLAIEQLTGYARPTVVALGGQSAVGSADALAKQQTYVDLQRATEESLKTAESNSQKVLNDAKQKTKASEEAKKAAEEKTGTAENTAKGAKDAYDQAVKDGKTEAELKPLKDAMESTKKEYDRLKGLSDAAAATNIEDKKKEASAQETAEKDAKALERQTAARERAEKTLAAMEKQVDISSASNPAQVFEPAAVTYTDAETAKAISSAVLQLQQTHLNQTFLMDECVRFVYHPEAVTEERAKTLLKTIDPKSKDEMLTAIKKLSDGSNTAISDVARFQECQKHFGAVDTYRQNLQDAYYGCKTTETTSVVDGKAVVVRVRECTKDATDLPAGAPIDPGAGLPFKARLDLEIQSPSMPEG